MHNSVGTDDMNLANNYPNVRHYAIGCGAIGQFGPHYQTSDTDVPYLNTFYGTTLSSICSNIQ